MDGVYVWCYCSAGERGAGTVEPDWLVPWLCRRGGVVFPVLPGPPAAGSFVLDQQELVYMTRRLN